jgi:hypothetical protein
VPRVAAVPLVGAARPFLRLRRFTTARPFALFAARARVVTLATLPGAARLEALRPSVALRTRLFTSRPTVFTLTARLFVSSARFVFRPSARLVLVPLTGLAFVPAARLVWLFGVRPFARGLAPRAFLVEGARGSLARRLAWAALARRLAGRALARPAAAPVPERLVPPALFHTSVPRRARCRRRRE